MSSLFRNTLIFVAAYVALMIPTYLLPWLGSNSAVMNLVGASIGHGMTPQWWAHAWCLVMLILMAWLRGDFIGKKYLPVFPFLAAVFDLTPGLSMIPLIPTALHLVAIIIAVKGSEQQGEGVVMAGGFGSNSRKAAVLAGLMTASAVFGSVLFVSTSKKTVSEFAEHKNDMPVKHVPSALPVAETMHAKVVSEPIPVPAVKVDTPLEATKHSAAVKHPHIQSHEQSAPKEAGKIRYINLND